MSNIESLDRLREFVEEDALLVEMVEAVEHEVSERFVVRGADSFEIQTVFGMTLDEVRQMMKRDAERRRTCKVEDLYLNDFAKSNYVSWYEIEMQCGCNFTWDEKEPPSYCPGCGGKVIK